MSLFPTPPVPLLYLTVSCSLCRLSSPFLLLFSSVCLTPTRPSLSPLLLSLFSGALPPDALFLRLPSPGRVPLSLSLPPSASSAWLSSPWVLLDPVSLRHLLPLPKLSRKRPLSLLLYTTQTTPTSTTTTPLLLDQPNSS